MDNYSLLIVVSLVFVGTILWYREYSAKKEAESARDFAMGALHEFSQKPIFPTMTDNQIVVLTRLMLEETEKLITKRKDKEYIQ